MTWSLAAGLEDRAVLVTGAAGGIGAEVCAAFAAAGSRVAAVDLCEEKLEALVAGLPDSQRHVSFGADLRNLDDVDALVDRTYQELGQLDIVAHLAGVILRPNDVMDVTAEDWAFQEEVNLRATFFLDRAAAQRMRATGVQGRIINFTSQAWWTGGSSVVYAATKGGVVSITRGLARIFAPAGITVNCIAPGYVDTPMLRKDVSEETLESFRAQVPLGRFALPSDVTGAVLFLASQHASYITGITLNLTGGQLVY